VHLLRKDLLNGPNHCFRNHDHCSTDFCSTAKNRLQDPQSASAAAVSTHSVELSHFDEGCLEDGSDECTCAGKIDLQE